VKIEKRRTLMKKFTTIALTAVLSLVALGTAAAQQAGTWPAIGRGRFFAQHLAHDLNLSDEQRASIKAILQKEKPAIQALAAQFAQQNAELRSKPAYDESFVRSVAQERAATVTEAMVEKEKVRAQIFAVLTPAQQQKVNQVTDEVRSMIQERLSTLGDNL
jgi:periplasmic protein CpxP/Spy